MTGTTAKSHDLKEPRLLFGRVRPFEAVKAIARQPLASLDILIFEDARLAEGLSVDRGQIARWRNDLTQRARLPQQLAARWRTGPGGTYSGGDTTTVGNEVLYLFVRAVRPALVIETGVAAGFSSSYLLQGLTDNGTGRMISIDLPTTGPEGRIDHDGVRDRSSVPTADQTGFVVPDELRPRWELRLGDAREVLPRTLGEVPSVDLFFHDSDHSYEHMLWEFRTAWPHVRSGGWLLSDDVTRNSAFVDFCREVAAQRVVRWAPGRWRGRAGIQKP
jgi:predicted O-methyltransferase YrrM